MEKGPQDVNKLNMEGVTTHALMCHINVLSCYKLALVGWGGVAEAGTPLVLYK